MGISVEMNVGNYETIRSALIEMGVPDEPFLDEILQLFGQKSGDSFSLLNNEYYEEYNSYYGVAEFIDRYYGVEDSFIAFLRNMKEANCNINVYDAAEALGVKLPESEEE